MRKARCRAGTGEIEDREPVTGADGREALGRHECGHPDRLSEEARKPVFERAGRKAEQREPPVAA